MKNKKITIITILTLFSSLPIFPQNLPKSKILHPKNMSKISSLSIISGTASENSTKTLIKIHDLTDNLYFDGKNWSPKKIWLQTQGTSNWHYKFNSKLTPHHKYKITSKAMDSKNNIEKPKQGNIFMLVPR